MPRQGEFFVGKFMPKNPEEFNANTKEYIGVECKWFYNRQLRKGEWSEEGYEGQWIVMPERGKMPFSWTFECDVEKTNET